MERYLFYIFIVIIMILILLMGVRFLSGNEDDWICVNKEWIKHGNPSVPKPVEPCGR